MKFFEDIEIGEGGEIGRFTFTAEDIKRFAAQFDPQPFHLDEDPAARSHFGGLVASGWHTASVFIKLLVEHRKCGAAELAARGAPVPKGGVSPGFRNLKWLKPVFAGDMLTYSEKMIRKRELATRPEWGLVFTHNIAVNQRGEPVFEFEGSFFCNRRDAWT
jgi:acyl dehydratase